MEGDAYCGAIRRTRKRISIHSLRMEGDNDFGYNLISDNISIHSLRMEGDDTHSGKNRQKTYFNPLPPHGGRRISSYHSGILRAFQSTPSAWRETSLFSKHFTNVHISIHSLRMEGDTIPENDLASVVISIHSLRMEGDPIADNTFNVLETFQSTPSAWRETRLISCNSGVVSHFNPLPPHGGRPTN